MEMPVCESSGTPMTSVGLWSLLILQVQILWQQNADTQVIINAFIANTMAAHKNDTLRPRVNERRIKHEKESPSIL